MKRPILQLFFSQFGVIGRSFFIYSLGKSLIMNKLILTLALNLLAVTFLFAQVSINNDNSSPDPSAMLDVKSNSKGLLAPRVALSAINVSDPIQAPALGLLVFNTVNAGTPPNNVVVGYYFWNGNRWIQSAAPLGVSLGDLQYWNGSQWITVPAGLPGQFLQMSQANIPVWAGSSFATIITTTPYNISASGAISGGTITSDGGSAITAKGICYNTAPNPTLANFKLTAGSGTNSFSANITGLVANTTYYIRAYATNTAGTAYGNEVVFTTLPEATVPVITTTAISAITATTATSGGSIINNGGAAVTARGVCWSTSSNPTIAGNKTVNGSGNGGFSSNLTGLTPNTLYYVRAYATNSAGTGYGNELSFTSLCSSSVTASVSITVSANPVCQGANVTFNATPTNGGTAPTYQWKVNGNNVAGATSTSYSYTPAQGDVVTCVMTSNQSCINGNPATSNAITMTVNPQLAASVTIAASANPVCEGTAVTFTATATNGGSNPQYQWKKNGTNIAGATVSTYTYIPANDDVITCMMTSNGACVSGSPATSNAMMMTIEPGVAVSVSITVSANPVVPGTAVTFTAVPTNGGESPAYQWKVNGSSVSGATNSSYTYTPFTGDQVSCTLTSNALCASGSPATSNVITMTVNSTCGNNITISHTAGSVAPVNKTVTYGTVDGIPGESFKCWITSNLGSDHQATAVDDATEATAGWYWQFNRKQGYKHDGSMRTPNTTWINGFSENSDWQTANDPCNLDFGAQWRLPTYTEWYNVDNTGGWTNWNGPWGSDLKLHAAGYLNISNGSLLYRGSNCIYWSSTQNVSSNGWFLSFSSSHSHMDFSNKAFGFSVRCLKDTCTSYSSTSISVTPSANPVCSGTSVTFTSTPTNGGSTPFYQWKVNGVFVGTNSPTYNYIPSNGDSIRCIMTSSAPCTSNPASSNTIIMAITNAPVATTTGTHTSSTTQINWNWNSVQGATGYKWNTANELNTAIDLGTATSKTETGLACDSLYTRYVWAYNGCGNSEVLTLTQSTLPCVFSCGDSITINHVAGDVAPVTKTTTYGTVTNIPGEESKCWITSNLGSDHQATAVNDATEASAGWYWQFNRKQGFKHDGTTRTPNTPWIANIIENSDWIMANDPCSIEFEGGWRIPTATEWTNVNVSGNWTNWNGPYTSGIKLHAAGDLWNTDGSLNSRGSRGYYWSSTQYGVITSGGIGFNNSASYMADFSKIYAMTLRCIQDTCSAYSSSSVLISPTANPICSGTEVIFTATPTNGGSSPFYQWKVNGAYVGTNSPAYSYIPENGDSIRCIMTSSTPCASNPATSNLVTMIVNPVLTASVSIAASSNPFIVGSSVTFTANVVNCGATPGYQWKVNGTPLGANNSTYTYAPSSGDVVVCLVTSNLVCVQGSPATSNSITMAALPGLPCAGVPTVSYEGKTYNTVQIGVQCWFRENLNIGTKINGSLEQTNNSTVEKYCYNDLDSNCDVYGGLYQWGEMVRYLNGTSNSTSWNPIPSNYVQGICPNGWHIPSRDEWLQLSDSYGGLGFSGGKLKEAGLSHWQSPNTGATNESGFTAIPGGHSYPNGTFLYVGTNAYFWTSSEHTPDSPSIFSWYYFPGYNYESLGQAGYYKTYGFSVRCLKNDCTAPPSSPSSGNHTPTQTHIIWNWTSVPEATGYKWNTTNDYATATDMGNLTTKTETGLTCNTSYTRYVWAYNACGNSNSITLTASTTACPFICGQSITVNHVAGVVAPVSKTVTYGTVTNITGEPTKCWITRNLGASQQPLGVDYADESAAGWYWQFNRKQGFKHDGAIRTPNSTWITSINENSDWLTSNDPCVNELGNGWRLPTYTEWYLVDASGTWTSWDGPWSSNLKLHAAGFISWANGSLGERGVTGQYTSSSQASLTLSWLLWFNLNSCYTKSQDKFMALSVRCIKD